PARPLCLVMGSSRLDMGFQPELAPAPKTPTGQPALVFNCSHNGAGPRMLRIHYDRLRRAGVRPRWLILELMPCYLSYEPDRFLGGHLPADDLPLPPSPPPPLPIPPHA